jgi:hypothetical protein
LHGHAIVAWLSSKEIAMPTDPSRRAARRVCRPPEQLEVRSLPSGSSLVNSVHSIRVVNVNSEYSSLSIGGSHVSSALLDSFPITISAPATYISQDASAVDVTITRTTSKSHRPIAVDFTAALGTTGPSWQSLSLPPSASNTFTPVNESVTFPQGVATETVSIPINPGAANPGIVPIRLSVTTENPNLQATPRTIFLVTGPQPVPPSITRAQLIPNGKYISGIAITFSQPMAPATVQTQAYYSVVAPARSHSINYVAGALDALYPFGLSIEDGPTTTGIKQVAYDQTTSTVTLTPAKPLKSTGSYEIDMAPLLTNVQGVSLQAVNSPAVRSTPGEIVLKLNGTRPVTFAPAPAPTVFGGD